MKKKKEKEKRKKKKQERKKERRAGKFVGYISIYSVELVNYTQNNKLAK